jgi:hypothetical protein
MKNFIYFLFLIISISVQGQVELAKPERPDLESDNDTMQMYDKFIGGETKTFFDHYIGTIEQFDNYIENNIRIPEIIKYGLKGEVWVDLTIDHLGNPIQILLSFKMEGCLECNSEVLRLLENIKKWRPAFIIDGLTGNSRKVTNTFDIYFKFPPDGFNQFK